MHPDIKASLKSLRLHGMALAWDELTENGESTRVDTGSFHESCPISHAACFKSVRSSNCSFDGFR